MDKKQIVFVNQSSGYLMIDIVNSFKENFDERILLTGILAERKITLDKDVKVEWLIKYKRTSNLKRIFTWTWAFLKALYLIRIKYKKAHLFIVSNPPFATLLPLFCKNSFDILIYDIYPDTFYEFKIAKKDSFIIKLWEKANVKIYKKATRIFTITSQMKERMSKYVSKDFINVIPIWTDNEFLKPIPKADNIFLKEHGVTDKFIVMYSGNLGKSHPVEILVDIAQEMKNISNLYFLIIGEGDKWAMIKNQIKNAELTNIKLLPWQTASTLPYSLSGADLAMVSIGNEASELAIPSKSYNLMSVGVPIICIANEASALAKLIKNHQNGSIFSEFQKKEISNFILKCISDLDYLNSLKLKSLEASLFYTPENVKKFH
jgi:glycosyltransferase involved in cell wall biosynthesis